MIDYRRYSILDILLVGKGSVIGWSLLYSLPCGIACVALMVFEEFREEKLDVDLGISSFKYGQMYTVLTTAVSLMLGFRIGQANGRFWEGTTLLHRMRGEWFDSASCLFTFSRKAKASMPAEVSDFRHTLVRMMSLMHACALMEISETPNPQKVLDLSGLDDTTLSNLKEMKNDHHFDMVEVLQHLIQVLVTHNHDIGVLSIPPPILSRVYQTLSRGFVALLDAKKIRDTYFPFPFIQIIAWMLILQALATPLVIASLIDSKVWGFIASMAPVFFTVALNSVSRALEMPFGSDLHDLPLARFQKELNKSLVLLLHDSADHVPRIQNTACSSWSTMKENAHKRASILPVGGQFMADERTSVKAALMHWEASELSDSDEDSTAGSACSLCCFGSSQPSSPSRHKRRKDGRLSAVEKPFLAKVTVTPPSQSHRHVPLHELEEKDDDSSVSKARDTSSMRDASPSSLLMPAPQQIPPSNSIELEEELRMPVVDAVVVPDSAVAGESYEAPLQPVRKKRVVKKVKAHGVPPPPPTDDRSDGSFSASGGKPTDSAAV